MAELSAGFTASSSKGQAPLNIEFMNTSTGSFASCLWNFGDGEQSALVHPMHTYTQTGSFTVTLRIFGLDNSENSFQRTIIATSSSSPTGSTQQQLSVFKRFDAGALAVAKVTIQGSTFETNSPFSASTQYPDSYTLGSFFEPTIASNYRMISISSSTLNGSYSASYRTVMTAEEENVLRTYSASTGWSDFPCTAMLLLKNSGATIVDGVAADSTRQALLARSLSGTSVISGGPQPALFYRIMSANTAQKVVWFDRPLPKVTMANAATLGQNLYLFGNSKIGPPAAIDQTFIQRAEDSIPYAANLNVLTGITEKVAKMCIALDSYDDGEINATGLTAILSGGPSKISGLMKYFGYASSSHSGSAIAFIYPHYLAANSFDRFYPGSIFLNFPWIMWHGNGSMATSLTSHGLKIYDSYGTQEVDQNSGQKFKYLRDGVTSTSNVVGKVFHDKKLLVLDDQELVATLQHTSNRNWTYPQCKANLIFQNYYEPWTKSGTSYFITYRIREDGSNGCNERWGIFSSLFPLHCRYITRVDDYSGNSALQIEIPAQPWATAGTACISGSPAAILGTNGAGWVAERLDLIIGTGLTTDQVANPNSWRIMSGGSDGIWSTKFNTNSFILSLAETDWCYYSGAPYSLGFSGSSVSGSAGMSIGEEWLSWSYLSGQVATDIYKMSAVCVGKPTEFNATQNETWAGGSDSTYISEVGLYNSTNDLLMVGKLSKPIEKNSQKYITVKLELDL